MIFLIIAAILFLTFVVYACVVAGARADRQMEAEWEQYCQEHPEIREKGA